MSPEQSPVISSSTLTWRYVCLTVSKLLFQVEFSGLIDYKGTTTEEIVRFEYIKDKIWQADFSDWTDFNNGVDFQMSLAFIGTASPQINWARMCPFEAKPNADQFPTSNFPSNCSPMEGNVSDR